MTYKAMKVNSSHTNRAHIERACVCVVSLVRTGSCSVAKEECLIQELGSRLHSILSIFLNMYLECVRGFIIMQGVDRNW